MDKLKTRRIVLLMAENIKLKHILHRWGLDEGIGGASSRSKTPKGAGVNL
jgi:hypothetical protein